MTDDNPRDFDHLWCAECQEITNHTTASHQEQLRRQGADEQEPDS